ncbi:vWA domain-containing protein [Solirubrobacter soli]|uniref:vWA domain-containing protein n=1 Tax=Solirubrobacter soli TaxID=363832 RepID=UPI000424F4D4|nr:VWA domain-containing protein [Solirubrobacter soli]
MLGRLAVVVLAAWLLGAGVARAQTSDTRNRALIVLDASKSMNEDAGNGGTRLDAAKKAVDALVDRLPEGAPLGLRVYGSKVSEVSRAEGCKDTELTVPVGPLDKDALRSTVNALQGKGRTPIGSSLLAVPDDLGSAEGRRSVVLVTDGGDNCAPPDPCKAAEEVARRGVEMSISVVGFQVNDRVRQQLRCIADAGGGSYVDVGDADKLGDELAALLSRAYRSYEPTGTKVAGGPSREQAAALGEGLFLDALPATEGDRWFSVDVPAGRRLVVSATAIPPQGSSGAGGFVLGLLKPGADHANPLESGIIRGALQDTQAGTTVTHSVRMTQQDPPGKYFFTVNLEHGTNAGLGVDVPVEIAVQLLKPGASVGMVRAPGALATPTATARPKASPAPEAADDDSALGNWLVVIGVLVGGLVVGFAAASVLTRKAAA